jgi:hypothetical protein
LDKFVS